MQFYKLGGNSMPDGFHEPSYDDKPFMKTANEMWNSEDRDSRDRYPESKFDEDK